MIQIDLQVKRLRSSATIPTKAHDTDLGYDLYSDADAILLPNAVVKIPTGIACAFPSEQNQIYAFGSEVVSIANGEKIHRDNWPFPITRTMHFGALIRDRSSVATKLGCIVVAGVIDHEYRGEIIVAMHNVTDKVIEIPAGSKIAQMILTPTYTVQVLEVLDFKDETDRGAKGFGSSGV